MRERRREIPMDDKHLAQLAENTARTLRPEGTASGRQVSRAVSRALERVRECQDRAAAWAEDRQHLPREVEWLLDNWYLAQREGREAERCFRRAGRLRAVRREGKQIMVLDLARALAWAGEVTGERIDLFLDRAQEVRPLTELELALFIPALKGALVERLESACRELAVLFGRREVFAGEEEALQAKAAGRPLSAAQEGALREAGAEHERLAKSMECVMTALRTLSIVNLGKLLEEQSRVERLLRRDPSGDYPLMDEETRGRYRQEVCRLARRMNLGEAETARLAVDLAEKGTGEERHVGWFLFRKPLGREKNCAAGAFYVGAVVIPTLFIVLLVGFLLDSLAVALLLLLPVSDIVKNCVDFLVVRLFRPRSVHRMALEGGVPEEGRTLCVIASLLTNGESGRELAGLLERYRLANRDAGEHLLLGVLADLPDSDLPMGTAARGYVKAAQAAVDGLNEKYGGGFYLFFRTPVFQSGDERYMGWERKRGALLELSRMLRGRRSGLEVRAGSRKALQNIKYVITLDSDTSLNVGAARELVGAMLHPLNRPRLDLRRKIVTSGYGILQPRVGVELGAANKSQFSRIFAGQGGVDPYGSTASDVYHDLFDQGTFTGKGIFDVDAFLTCLDGRFPQNRVLSHDLLEGSYLHAGLIGDVELTDSYPYKVTSYFARLHRWVRGDWQLLPWLGGHVRDQDGARVPNPIPPMAKWKIFDNLRRSLSPVCTLLALLLGMCLPGYAFGVAAAAAVLAAASNLLLSGADLAFRRGRGLRARYHSTIIAGFGGVILQTLVQLLFLPVHAWTCASAAATALWRSFVSHRGMLAWVTAADAERRAGDGVWANYRKQWSAVAVGLVAIGFSLFPAGAAMGLVWAASPIFAWAMSRPIDEKRVVPPNHRAFLLHEGALIWQYFADFLRPEDHWLPPDNWQEQPAVGLARRTSPTNIGMALLCVLASADLDFLTREAAVELLGHMLDTLEALPKWRGHLYNWYDTSTAQPLPPRYISTVDGGNLCGCLIAAREGLYEWGEGELARRAEALSDAMDFSLLYDADRKLFYIGYDAEKQAYTQGWYDLMASEARQTSYLAVARGEVEKKHWRRLGRMLVKDNNYFGMASWTGTMFEYFMPNLLLPCEPNSMMYESLAFCLYAQRRRTARRGIPWGISESCFYAFDPGMSYQYKAHGVQKLGLKRGLDSETVISPYSSFLALLLAPGRGANNLRRLRDMGLEGKYGLYEAADFTPARLTGDEGWEPVRCYMAHHLGMSLVAVDNALNDGVMQGRFMRDCSMSAYRELLQEKVPVGAAVMRAPEREVPDKPKRARGTAFQRGGAGFDRLQPACHLVSNGSYTVFCTDAGATASSMGETALTLAEFRKRDRPAGVSFFLRDNEGTLRPLTGAPCYGGAGGEHTWRFTGGGAEWTIKCSDFTAKTCLRVRPRENGELREAELAWTGREEFAGEIVCYLEPVLARQRDYDAHPAFSKLSIQSERVEDGVLFTRRAGKRGERLSALAVVWDGAEAGFDTDRASAIGRGGLRGLENALRAPAQETVGAVLDPCLLARFPVRLAPGEKAQLRLALGVAEQGEDAALTARRLLKTPKLETGSYLDGLLQAYHMTGENTLQAFRLMERLAFPAPRENGAGAVPSQERLWPFGVSGDDPIAVCRAEAGGETEPLLALVRSHKLLSRCGFRFDLVFLLEDGGDYRRPTRNALLDGLKALGVERQIGARGGIHLADCPTDEAAQPILAAAAVRLTPGESLEAVQAAQAADAVRQIDFRLEPGLPEARFREDGTFVFTAGRRLPPVGWSQMLSNPFFGWMADETGCGHLWRGNARENQLTPWYNDPLMVGGPERLFAERDGVCCSLFADGDGLDCKVRYGMGYACWEKRWGALRMRTTAFVPADIPARVLLVELDGGPEGAEICYRTQPLLAAEKSAARYVETVCNGNCLVVQNPWNRSFWPQSMLVAASAELKTWHSEGDGVLEARWNAAGRFVLVVGCAATKWEENDILALTKWAEAEGQREKTLRWWDERVNALTVDTACPALDRYLNGWALYQTVACRLLGRTSRYQSGGAYGFRDQLQDVCAVLNTAPELAREQLLSACAHQFREGDVQHWWHETAGKGADRGVRTRISDDLLWLPYALCEYLDKTGDRGILEEQVPYLAAPPLGEREQERYEQSNISQEMDSVYGHAVRAVENALSRGTGGHGLALMGAGDWNDGMNRVGALGRGESVWLTWFTAHVLERFAPLAAAQDGAERAAKYRAAAGAYTAAANAAWDGDWFLRGYYDDGSTLGSSGDEECRIDSIAQSWAAMAEKGDREKARKAVRAALDRLLDREHSIVKLFAPAFDSGAKDPGYIRGYVPGVRENGGQYTHAAVWLALACLRLDMPEEGWRVLENLLPSARDASIYQAEPYVLAADVYANPAHMGRGGWSWYTGAAGWYYRVAVEELLGLRLREGRLFIEPRLPADWPGYSARWRTGRAVFHITVRRTGQKETRLDGRAVQTGIELGCCEGEHQVEASF